MLYVRLPLSLRNVEDLLHERGIYVSHEANAIVQPGGKPAENPGSLLRERAMLRFRRMRSLQKFAIVHAAIYNLFNSQRTLTSRPPKQNRAVALAEWRGLGTA